MSAYEQFARAFFDLEEARARKREADITLEVMKRSFDSLRLEVARMQESKGIPKHFEPIEIPEEVAPYLNGRS